MIVNKNILVQTLYIVFTETNNNLWSILKQIKVKLGKIGQKVKYRRFAIKIWTDQDQFEA